MSTIFKFIGLALIAVLGVIFAIWIGLYVLGFIAFFVAIAIIAVIAGVPISVRKDGVLIGHWKRGKFYPRGHRGF
jgi:hypothetical protein